LLLHGARVPEAFWCQARAAWVDGWVGGLCVLCALCGRKCTPAVRRATFLLPPSKSYRRKYNMLWPLLSHFLCALGLRVAACALLPEKVLPKKALEKFSFLFSCWSPRSIYSLTGFPLAHLPSQHSYEILPIARACGQAASKNFSAFCYEHKQQQKQLLTFIGIYVSLASELCRENALGGSHFTLP